MLPIVEIFGNTIQGEGCLIGRPAIFVRTFGCNLNCRGFGMKPGEMSDEADNIMNNPTYANVTDIKDLPLTKTGCDSYPAIHPLCARLVKKYTTSQVVDRIQLINGVNDKYTKPLIVFTGGEPLLHQKTINTLMCQLYANGYKEFMFETNGTLEPMEFDVLKEPGASIIFSVSPKLSNSGNDQTIARNPLVLASYNKLGYTYLKFVVDKTTNISEIMEYIDTAHMFCEHKFDVFLMPEGGVLDERSRENAVYVANLCWQYGYRFSPREHLTIFGNAWAK